MEWFNPPLHWNSDDSNVDVTVEAGTDYWQITHYGFIRDNGHFYYNEVAGDFEATVKVTGNYMEQYHQAGLMIRIDEKNWIKTGIEYVDSVQHVSAVVTRNFSDWSVIPCNDNPSSTWLKLRRRKDYVEIKYSLNNTEYHMLRLAYFPPDIKVMIGIVAAAPGNQSFTVNFASFKVHVF